MNKLFFSAKQYFQLTKKNIHWSITPIFWIISPLAIIFGALFLEKWMMEDHSKGN